MKEFISVPMQPVHMYPGLIRKGDIEMKEIIGEDNFMKLLSNMKEGDYGKHTPNTVEFFIKNAVIKEVDIEKIEKKISTVCMITNKDISLRFSDCTIIDTKISDSCLDYLVFERCQMNNVKLDHLALAHFCIGNSEEKIYKLVLSKSSIELLSLTGEDMNYMQESLFENNKIDSLYVDTLDMRCNMAKNNKISYIAKIANVKRGW